MELNESNFEEYSIKCSYLKQYGEEYDCTHHGNKGFRICKYENCPEVNKNNIMITESNLLEAIKATQTIIERMEYLLVSSFSDKCPPDYKVYLDEIDTYYRVLRKLKTMMQERFGVVL